MPSSASDSKKKARAVQYSRTLRERRKEQGMVQIHWFIPEAAKEAIEKAAEDEDRKVQQYINLNVWYMVPEKLWPEDIRKSLSTEKRRGKAKLK